MAETAPVALAAAPPVEAVGDAAAVTLAYTAPVEGAARAETADVLPGCCCYC